MSLDQHADFAFAYGAREGPRAFVSTIKLRQAGFTKTIDTEDSFRNALQSLIDQKLLEDPTPLKLAELIEREFGGFVPPKMFDD